MSDFLRALLPNSDWVLAARNGEAKDINTFSVRERDSAEAFISTYPGREILVLAGRARTFICSPPSIEHVASVCAVGIRVDLSQKSAIKSLANPPGISFEHRGLFHGKTQRHFVAAWRFERPIPPREADRIEALIAERLNGERLRFFIPVPRDDQRQDFLPRFIEPKNVEAALRGGCASITHDDPAVKRQAEALMETLADYGFDIRLKAVSPGPVVTLHEFELARGTKADAIASRADDIARDVGAQSARVITNLGPRTIGIELPSARRETVLFRDLVQSSAFKQSDAALPIALGRDAKGNPLIVDLAPMPHLMLAGTTGSGKSVLLSTIILSLLHKFAPSECKLVLIDAKKVDLSVFEDIPNLLCRVVTDTPRAIAALNGMVTEMNARYEELRSSGVRNIKSFNAKRAPEDRMPYIVVVVDELAKLMADKDAGETIKSVIQSLSQEARAAGIHLIVATQRPSVDVIPGVIKANLPARIALSVRSATDSRVILDEVGAEALLGQGDMLYQTAGGKLIRAHGAYVSESEVEDAVKACKLLGKPDYHEFDADVPEVSAGHGRRVKRLNDGPDRVWNFIDLAKGDWTRTEIIQRAVSATGASVSTIKNVLKEHPRVRIIEPSCGRKNVPARVVIR